MVKEVEYQALKSLKNDAVRGRGGCESTCKAGRCFGKNNKNYDSFQNYVEKLKSYHRNKKEYIHFVWWYNVVPKSQGDWLLCVSHTVRGPEVDNGTLSAVKSHTIWPAPILYFIKKTLSYRSGRWQVHCSNEKAPKFYLKKKTNKKSAVVTAHLFNCFKTDLKFR